MTDTDVRAAGTGLADQDRATDARARPRFRAQAALIAADNERALHAAVADVRAGLAAPGPAAAADPAAAAVQVFAACARSASAAGHGATRARHVR